MLTVAGLQLPVKLFSEVVGRTGAVAPEQIAGMALNAGVTFGLTRTVSLWVVEHWPAAGVKV